MLVSTSAVGSTALYLPVSLLIAGVPLGLVSWRVRDGDYEDGEGPAERVPFDDDSTPEREA